MLTVKKFLFICSLWPVFLCIIEYILVGGFLFHMGQVSLQDEIYNSNIEIAKLSYKTEMKK